MFQPELEVPNPLGRFPPQLEYLEHEPARPLDAAQCCHPWIADGDGYLHMSDIPDMEDAFQDR